MRIALSEGRNELDKKSLKIFKTPGSFKEGIEIFKKAKEDFGIERAKRVVGGIAGTFDADKSQLIHSPNMPGWVNQPLKKELEKLFSADVFIENDAVMAGIGEANMGAGRGYDIMAYITLGTGVGGARFVRGQLDENAFGFEPGHQIICFEDDPCSCGGKGHLESYVSGTAIWQKYGKRGSDLNKEERKEVTEKLVVGLYNVTVMWSPDIIVLGGGLAKDGIFSLKDLVGGLKKMVFYIFRDIPEIKTFKLKEFSALYGSLIKAQELEG